MDAQTYLSVMIRSPRLRLKPKNDPPVDKSQTLFYYVSHYLGLMPEEVDGGVQKYLDKAKVTYKQ